MASASANGQNEAQGGSKSERYTGIVKLVVQVNKGEITTQAFWEGIEAARAQLKGVYDQMCQQVREVGEGAVHPKLLESFLAGIDDCRQVLELGMVQFRTFVDSGDKVPLRVGLQLVHKGVTALEDLNNKLKAIAQGDSLVDSEDVLGAVGSEVMQGSLPLSEYPAALGRLKQVFEESLERAHAQQEEVINLAKSLIDEEEDPEAQRQTAQIIMEKISRLQDAYGVLIISVHAPQYIKRVLTNMMVG